MPGMVNHAEGQRNDPKGKASSARSCDVAASDVGQRGRGGRVVAGTHSQIARLIGLRQPSGGSRSFTEPRKRRDCTHLTAHEGCVWSVTVKDPRRFPNKRQFRGCRCRQRGRHPTERAQPVRDFWTFRNRNGLAIFDVENGGELFEAAELRVRPKALVLRPEEGAAGPASTPQVKPATRSATAANFGPEPSVLDGAPDDEHVANPPSLGALPAALAAMGTGGGTLL